MNIMVMTCNFWKNGKARAVNQAPGCLCNSSREGDDSHLDLGCTHVQTAPMFRQIRATVHEIVRFVCGASTSNGAKYVWLWLCVLVFAKGPTPIGLLRIDDGDVWNANDPHVWTQEERAESGGELQILPAVHGRLELQSLCWLMSIVYMIQIPWKL